MEKDDEVKGIGNSYDFGVRMFDPRVGRWFAPDPLENEFPYISTYVYALNNPINVIDEDGRAPDPVIIKYFQTAINSMIRKDAISLYNNISSRVYRNYHVPIKDTDGAYARLNDEKYLFNKEKHGGSFKDSYFLGKTQFAFYDINIDASYILNVRNKTSLYTITSTQYRGLGGKPHVLSGMYDQKNGYFIEIMSQSNQEALVLGFISFKNHSDLLKVKMAIDRGITAEYERLLSQDPDLKAQYDADKILKESNELKNQAANKPNDKNLQKRYKEKRKEYVKAMDKVQKLYIEEVTKRMKKNEKKS